MNVYQRPLFRQMGGPVAPGMAAQEAQMAMPPAQDPQMMLQQAQAQAAQEAMPVGEMFAQETMANLDAAETPEQIINALRGNERPMDERYAELAGFVGEQDARSTPESVLALVQPTIMMTEQGAMDSGIGELLRTMTGDVPMETPDGQPTAMGQGVGSLMMAGAPQPEMGVGQQPVANFRQGGVVQRFQEGGEASRLQALYSEMLPTYQSIMGDGGEQRRMGQAQVLFDIADRAAAFAAGIDPRTGQSVARLSPAAQLGAAVSGLGGQIGQRVGDMEAQDRALRMTALQAAQSEYSAERADQRAAARAAAAGSRDRALGNLYDVYDGDGNIVQQGVPIATQNEYASIMESIPGGRIAPSQTGETDFNVTTLYAPGDGRPVSFNTGTAAGRAEAQEALGSGFTSVAPPAPGDTVVLLNPDDPEQSVVVQAGTPGYNEAYSQGFRRAEEIEAQRGLLQPAEPVTYVNPNNPSDIVRAVPGSPEANAAAARGLLPVGDASTVAGMLPEPGDTVVLLNPDDPEQSVVVQAGTREYAEAYARGFRRAEEIEAQRGLLQPAEPVTYVNPNNPSDIVRAVPGSPEANAAAARGLLPVGDASTVAGMQPDVASPLIDPDLMEAYGAGRTTPEETALIQDAISERMQPVWNSRTEQYEQPLVTPIILGAEQARRDAGLPTVVALPDAAAPATEGEARLRSLEERGGAAFGTAAFGREFANAVFALVDANAPAPQTQEGVDAVNALNQDALIAFREVTAGRPAQDAINQFQTLLPSPARIGGSPSSAASEVRELINLFNAQIAASRDAAASGRASATQRQQLEQAIINSQRMVAAYEALLRGIQGGTTSGGAVNPADFRR